MATKHGDKLLPGHCSNTGHNCTEWHGLKLCFAHPGEIDTSILELDSIHAWHKGDCYDATGTTPRIKELEKHAKDHGVKVEHGKCKHTNQCKEWRQMKVCRTAPHEHHHGAEEWNGTGSIHGVMKHGGKEYCMQYDGKTIRDAKVDDLIAKKLAAHHVTLKEGGCGPHFADEIVHRELHHNITLSVWAH